jgi:aspartyl-tRNA(Asn)/glutamyl-tRNA(Gln) amidotransferase subunit B
VRPLGSVELGTKTEIKNINSFRFVEKAIDYEIRRQIEVLNEGGTILQETRLWDSESGVTKSMRSKEEAHDYRYFPEPDLVPLEVPRNWIDDIRASLPELPDAKRERYITEYDLPEYDAEILIEERGVAEWFEGAVALEAKPKTVSNWMMTELLRCLNETGKDITEAPPLGHFVDMLRLIDDGTISGNIGKKVFEEMFHSGKDAETIVKEKGLVQITDTGAIENLVDEILAKHSGEVERYKGGEEKLLGFFVGQIMKASKGKANPKLVNELLRKRLS